MYFVGTVGTTIIRHSTVGRVLSLNLIESKKLTDSPSTILLNLSVFLGLSVFATCCLILDQSPEEILQEE